MDAFELLNELTRRGVELAVVEDRLRFRPHDVVTPDLRSALVEHKAALIWLLNADRGGEVIWRVRAMRPQVVARKAVPILLARPEARTSPRGTCASCGDQLTEERRTRCTPCVSAVMWLLNEVHTVR